MSRKMALMNTPRYLCSQLVRLSEGGRELWVNLEEIWENGAVLECEEAVAMGAGVRISSGEDLFEGRVTGVKKDEFGWQVELEFSARTPWSISQWRPEHAL